MFQALRDAPARHFFFAGFGLRDQTAFHAGIDEDQIEERASPVPQPLVCEPTLVCQVLPS